MILINNKQFEQVMEQLMQQNVRLRSIMVRCEEEMMKLKKIGQEHEEELGNLLKFNQKLLYIIQNHIPSRMIIKSSSNQSVDANHKSNNRFDNNQQQDQYQYRQLQQKFRVINAESYSPSSDEQDYQLIQHRQQQLPLKQDQLQQLQQLQDINQITNINRQKQTHNKYYQSKQQINSIRLLVDQYKDDFNTQQYSHLCNVIKDDLECDLKEIIQLKKNKSILYESKQKQCQRIKLQMRQFNAISNLIGIMRGLNVSEQIERMVIDRVTGRKVNNSSSNVSIMEKCK